MSLTDSQSQKMTSLEADASASGWIPVFWEPVADTSERLMVGAIVRIRGQVTAHRIIRDDVLECLYGKAAAGAKNLIDFTLEDLRLLAEHGGVQSASKTTSGCLFAGEFHATGQENLSEALRTVALMYSSMAAIDRFDEQESEDDPQPEEVNKRFATEVREYVVGKKPEFKQYFNRKAELLENGRPVSFGFCSATVAAHFSTLHPVRQSAGVRDARAKLWELSSLREYACIPNTCLIIGRPSENDPTLSQKQRDALKGNLDEIEMEADKKDMRIFPVTSASEGGDRIISLHAA